MRNSLLVLVALAGSVIQAEPIVLDLDSGINIKDAGDYVIRGTTKKPRPQLVVNARGKSVNITFDNIDLNDTANNSDPNTVFLDGRIHLFLKGRNSVRSGGGPGARKGACAMALFGDTASSLRIDEAPRSPGDPDVPGSLWLSGSDNFFQGVAGLCGNVVIGSGEVHAKGGSRSPGIESVRIEGGTVDAQGGSYASGIVGNIVITGGTVTASGDSYASGISGDLLVTGGKTTAVAGSFCAAIAGSKQNGSYQFDQYHIRIEGGEVYTTKEKGSSGTLGTLGIGKQFSRFGGDPCGMVEITGGLVHTGAPGTSSETGICGDSIRITGGTIMTSRFDASNLVVQGGTFPWMCWTDDRISRVFYPRWNGTDSTYLLRIWGLPKNAMLDSLHLDADPNYGTRDLRTDSAGQLGVTVPKGLLNGVIGLNGKVYPFSKIIAPDDGNIYRFDSSLSIQATRHRSLPLAHASGDRIVLDGIHRGDRVQVFDLNGQLLFDGISTSGHLTIPSPGPGLHLVRCPTSTLRVLSPKP